MIEFGVRSGGSGTIASEDSDPQTTAKAVTKPVPQVRTPVECHLEKFVDTCSARADTMSLVLVIFFWA